MRKAIRVEGIVQGVGFRPFLHRLARRFALGGWCLNFVGGVLVEVEGEADAVEAFQAAIAREAPPMAVVDQVSGVEVPPRGETRFRVLPSDPNQPGQILISPDASICAECERELADPADRRYGHPFINCTNCGPRFTIVADYPYDRPLTSMGKFPMCPRCAAEYENIDDRRYHAQPIACPDCGPTLQFVASTLQATGQDAFTKAAALIRGGKTVAVKGLGGFHLACDATDEAAVARLRQRKHRDEKPFAIMVSDLAEARRVCLLTPSAESALTSVQKPIVIAPKRPGSGIAHGVAPDSRSWGIMLPYTPLHILLMQQGFRALVMTSGNLSDEPLATDNQEAASHLGHIADGFLIHDRDILVPCDDSVVRTVGDEVLPLRRARGYVPFPVRLGESVPPVLACGGHLKNTVCLTRDNLAFLSQHIGDLDDAMNLAHFERIAEHIQRVLRVRPQAVAYDLHPDYGSTRYALTLPLPHLGVQHHHAHAVSCMAEQGLAGPVLALACDGTGYGDDGFTWGCELLWATDTEYRRLGHMKYLPLPGADAAAREPWRIASAWAYLAMGERFLEEWPLSPQVLGHRNWPGLKQMLDQNLNCPLASSLGRLFDCAAALLGVKDVNTYEGQAAMMLEARAVPAEGAYPFAFEDGALVLHPLPIIPAMLADLRAGVPVEVIAGRFHNTAAAFLVEMCLRARSDAGTDQVVLSGGCFQNELLTLEVTRLLESKGFKVYTHRQVPPGDGGISLGQAVIAAKRIEG